MVSLGWGNHTWVSHTMNLSPRTPTRGIVQVPRVCGLAVCTHISGTQTPTTGTSQSNSLELIFWVKCKKIKDKSSRLRLGKVQWWRCLLLGPSGYFCPSRKRTTMTRSPCWSHSDASDQPGCEGAALSCQSYHPRLLGRCH